MTGNLSLYIQNPENLDFQIRAWRQSYIGPMPVPGSRIELKGFLKGENVKNTRIPERNICFSLKVYPHKEGVHPERYVHFENSFLEGGTPITIAIESLPSDVSSLSVSLNFPISFSGKIYLHSG
ncbi:hypothetical protein [Anditalea andensis]|uniref:Uncharacterized protein n=1 Tax=Anditalea andensis TaxID=1048983 RepID=A0A074KYQ3_9BACT|nr:hypothetical protein [Anditalea andensis]KEO73365.1 hypothetical protein EL17_13560 [Anditalea andensis]